MNQRTHRHSRGFTLIEILIVVVILGILAGIVMPRFGQSASQTAEDALRAQLRQIRQAIQLYQAHHGQLPDLVSDWEPLTAPQVARGKQVGPFLQSSPINPLNKNSYVLDGDLSTPAAGEFVGFIYDYGSGSGTGYIVATNRDETTIFRE